MSSGVVDQYLAGKIDHPVPLECVAKGLFNKIDANRSIENSQVHWHRSLIRMLQKIYRGK